MSEEPLYIAKQRVSKLAGTRAAYQPLENWLVRLTPVALQGYLAHKTPPPIRTLQ
jgi:hypothetical protein